MRVVSALKKYCEYCSIIRKGKKLYVKCIKDPRHKQRQGHKFSTAKIFFGNNNNEQNINSENNEIDSLIQKLRITNIINNK